MIGMIALLLFVMPGIVLTMAALRETKVLQTLNHSNGKS